MQSVQAALATILADFKPCPPENVPLRAALGRTLAASVIAQNDLPHFDNSSMDGYAVRAADVATCPVTLKVVGDIPAGISPTFGIMAGEAARIMTGAPVPKGADTIVPIEDTDQNRATPELPNQVTVHHAGNIGAYIRKCGEDVRTGDELLAAGHILRPQDLGLLAGLGVASVTVIQRPRVAIFSTGDELLPPDAPLEPGKIRDMNSFTLPAMVQSLGAEPIFLGTAADTVESVRDLLGQAVELGVDLIISSAGVSVGARDVVKLVLDELGMLDFWKVNMRPGKPLAYGHVQGIPLMGVPGNPVSALASFEVFVRPAILKMLGQNHEVPTVEVVVGEDMQNDGRESYIRVVLRREAGQLVAYLTGTQSSGAISSLVKADALLIVPASVTQVKRGDVLRIRSFAGQSFLL